MVVDVGFVAGRVVVGVGIVAGLVVVGVGVATGVSLPVNEHWGMGMNDKKRVLFRLST